MLAGLFLLFPRLRRAEIEFEHHLSAPQCVESLVLDVRRDGTLIRRHKERVGARSALQHTAKLSHASYLAIARMECVGGDVVVGRQQPIVVDRDGVIQFKLMGERCCETRVRGGRRN